MKPQLITDDGSDTLCVGNSGPDLFFFYLEITSIPGAFSLGSPKKKGQYLLGCTFCVIFGQNRH